MCFLPQSLIILTDLGLPHPLELEDQGCGNSDFPFVDAEIVRDRLYQLSVQKFMGPDGVHPRVLKETADVMAGVFLILWGGLC